MTVADQTMEIGLGMKPSLTGKGLGFDFLKNAIDFVLANYICERSPYRSPHLIYKRTSYIAR